VLFLDKKKHLGKEKQDSLKKEVSEPKAGKEKQDSPKKETQDSPKKELAELKESLQRVQAEFENSRKRLEREKQDFLRAANAGLAKELLQVLDSVDSAADKLDEQREVRKEEAVEGIELIKKQLLAILRSHGLKEIDCLGKTFDPMIHDCVVQGHDKSKGDGIVLQELQKGYILNGMILRHSKVKVNKK